MLPHRCHHSCPPPYEQASSAIASNAKRTKLRRRMKFHLPSLDEVRFSDARPGPAVGNIGYDVLRDFVVTLDSKNRRIRLDQ